MVIDYDINANPIIFNAEVGKWHDSFGNDVTSTKLAHFQQRGDITGIAIDSVGVKTFPVTFAPAYTNVLDEVLVNLKDLTATDAVISEIWISGDTVTGFTLNVHVTTASATAGATAKAHWVSLGQ